MQRQYDLVNFAIKVLILNIYDGLMAGIPELGSFITRGPISAMLIVC